MPSSQALGTSPSSSYEEPSLFDLEMSTRVETSFPKSKIKILLLEGISQRAVNIFNEETFQVECIKSLTKEELIEKIKTVHAIGIRSRTKLTADVLEHAKRLLCIGCFCIGTDQVDLSVAAKRGIPVFNSPFCNSRSVAELIIAQIISLSRKLGDKNRELHEGRWNKSSAGCHEIRGKTVGIIGYGHIGTQLSVLAENMGMKVLFYDIVRKLPLGNARACSSYVPSSFILHSSFFILHYGVSPDSEWKIY